MARTRWHELRDALATSNLPASDKAVYRALLDKADFRTACLDPRYTPRQAVIAKETSLSLRQVKYAEQHLARHGWLAATGATGPGRTRRYELAAGGSCDCSGRRHAPGQRVQPAPSTTGATGATECPNGCNHCTRTGATNGCNAAGQTPNPTERQREEGEVREEPEPEVPRCCPDCGGERDPAIGAFVHRPGCWTAAMFELYERETR